jgi:hypothetical protein
MRKKTLSRVLALCFVLFAANATAQEGLFQRGMSDETYYGFGSAKEDQSLFNNRSVETTGIIDNQVFGQSVPVGSGVILLLAAGAGYAILKRKEDEQ